MTQKSIETILRLSKNPSYRLTEEEIETLKKHNAQFETYKHSTDFKKDDGKVKKHDTELKEE